MDNLTAVLSVWVARATLSTIVLLYYSTIVQWATLLLWAGYTRRTWLDRRQPARRRGVRLVSALCLDHICALPTRALPTRALPIVFSLAPLDHKSLKEPLAQAVAIISCFSLPYKETTYLFQHIMHICSYKHIFMHILKMHIYAYWFCIFMHILCIFTHMVFSHICAHFVFAYFSIFMLIMHIYCIFLICLFVHIPAYFILHIPAYLNMHIMAYFPSCIFKNITHISAYKMHIMNILGLLCTYIAYFSYAFCAYVLHIWFCIFRAFSCIF